MRPDFVSNSPNGKEDIEIGILREMAISNLEKNPWEIGSLEILSELSSGDEKRLYLHDILKSKPSNHEFTEEFIRWEIEEELVKPVFNQLRLANRISAIMSIVEEDNQNYGVEIFSKILTKTLRKFFEKGDSKSLILGLKSCIVASGGFPNLTELILREKIPGTKTAITDLLKDRKMDIDKDFILDSMICNPYLFTEISIRRMFAKEILERGDYELSYWFSMKSVDIYPQDHESALIALKSAIGMGDDNAILVAGGTILSMKNEPEGIPYEKIASSSLRMGRVEYAKDILKRRRMKLGIEGHRLRVGIPFQEGEYVEVVSEISNTPRPHSENDSIKSYKVMSLCLKGEKNLALGSIEEISDPLEKRLLRYYCQFNSGDFKRAANELNSHLSVYGMRKIRQQWAENECKFLELGVEDEPVKSPNFGKISVIMTCHKWNPALRLAVESVQNQSYQNIEFIFVDDHSPKVDLEKYDKILGEDTIRIRMSENMGTYACRNEGIKIAKGKFITFADSDDWIHPDKIVNSLEFLIENRAEMVVGRYIRMNDEGSIEWNGVRFARFALVGMTFRTSTLKEKLVGFDGRMRHSADSELYERAVLLLGRRKVLRYPVVGIFALDSSTSLTKSGELTINWYGSSGARSLYNDSYRRHHNKLKNLGYSKKGAFFDFRSTLDEIPEKYIGKRSSVNYNGLAKLDQDSQNYNDEPILVTMCTYPGGFSTVEGAISSLLFEQTREISQLRLVVNGGKMPDNLPKDDRLVVIQSEKDLTDRGKFFEIGKHEGYVITTDDDIRYPYDYVEKMVSFVDQYSRKSLIGVHGAHIPRGPPITRWWEYANVRRSHVFAQEMPEFVPVNVIGTGTLAFHTSLGFPGNEDLDYNRMVDLHLAVWAQKNKIPMYICPRKRDWLVEIASGNVNRIWQTAKEDGGLQHRMLEVLQRCGEWELYSPRSEGSFESTAIFETFNRWQNRELCPGMVLESKSVDWPKISSEPLVTIYIPAYNCQDFIVETVKSALNQTYRNFEICIHNDGSTDKTLSVIRRKFLFNRKVKISSGRNGGIGHASNSAIEMGSGELILQLDSDDILHPNALELLVKEIEDGIVCSYGSFVRISEDGKNIDDGWDWPYYTHQRLLRSMIIHHPRLFRRDAWKEIGGFNEEIANAVDYDFFLRLGEVGDMRHISEKLYSYRIHQLSTSQEKRSLQTDNTIIVQRMALKRMGLESFVNFAPNPDFPRRVNYRYEAFSDKP